MSEIEGPMDSQQVQKMYQQDMEILKGVGDRAAADATYMSTLEQVSKGNLTPAQLQEALNAEQGRLDNLVADQPKLAAAKTAGNISDTQLLDFQRGLTRAQAAVNKAQAILDQIKAGSPAGGPGAPPAGGAGAPPSDAGNAFFATGSYTAFFLAMQEVVQILKENQQVMGLQQVKDRTLAYETAQDIKNLQIKIGETEAEKAEWQGYSELIAGGTGLVSGFVGAGAASSGQGATGAKIGMEMGQSTGMIAKGAIQSFFIAPMDITLGGLRGEETAMRDAYENTKAMQSKAAEQFTQAGDGINSATQQMTQTSGQKTIHWVPGV